VEGGRAAYFDVDFAGENTRKPTRFTTGPQGAPTHWKQTALYLPTPLEVPAAGVAISGTVSVRKSLENPRAVVVELTVAVGDAPAHTHVYNMR
jgi:hypothetical protein